MAQNILTAIINADGSKFEKTINEMKADLKSFQKQLGDIPKGTPAFDAMTQAIINQKNAIQQAEAGVKAFSTSTFGVSRAGRIAHTDLDQMVRSFELVGRGGEGAGAALSNMIFTFERLQGATGGLQAGFGQLFKSLMGPAGIVLGVSTLIALAPRIIDLFTHQSEASKKAAEAAKEQKKEIDSLAGKAVDEIATLTELVGIIQNHNTTREEQRKALAEINKQYGPLLQNMGTEKVTVDNLTDSYHKLVNELLQQAVVKGAQDEITKRVKETAAQIINLRLEQQKQAEQRNAQQEKEKNVQQQETDRVKHLGETTVQNTRATSDNTNTHLIHSKTVQQDAAKVTDYQGRIDSLTESLIKQVAPLLDIAKSLGDLGIKPPDTKELEKGLTEAERILVNKVKELQDFFTIPINLVITDEDTGKQALQKVNGILEAIKKHSAIVNGVEVPVRLKPISGAEIKEIQKDFKIEPLVDVGKIKTELQDKTLLTPTKVPFEITPKFQKIDIDLKDELQRSLGGIVTPEVVVSLHNMILNRTQDEEDIKFFSREIIRDVQKFAGVLSPELIIDLSQAILDQNSVRQKAIEFQGEFNKAIKEGKFSFSGVLDLATNADQLTNSAATLAKTIDSTLTPAFDNLFDAILKGQSPLQAFVKSIEDSVSQLIKKIVQATVEAAVLQQTLPKGTQGADFGSLFRNLLGVGTVGAAQGTGAAAQTAATTTATTALGGLSTAAAGTATAFAPLITSSASLAGTQIALAAAATSATVALGALTTATIIEAATKTTSGFLSVLGKMLSFIPFFAEGGRPEVGKAAIVGEKGPELFVPDSAGTIFSNKETSKLLDISKKSITANTNVSNTSVRDSVKSIRDSVEKIYSNKTSTIFSNKEMRILGEKGPELFMPKTSGYVFSNSSIKELFKSSEKISNISISELEKIKSISGFRQFGGPVTAGGQFIVGEGGRELFIPNSFQVPRVSTPMPTQQNISGGIKVEVTGEFVQRGQNLVAVISQVNRTNGRNF